MDGWAGSRFEINIESTEPTYSGVRCDEDGNPAFLDIRAVIFDSISFASSSLDEYETSLNDICTIWTQSLKSNREAAGHGDEDRGYLSLAFVRAFSSGMWSGRSLEDLARTQKGYAPTMC